MNKNLFNMRFMRVNGKRNSELDTEQDKEFFKQLCCSLAPAAYSVFRGVLTRDSKVTVARTAEKAAYQITALADAIVKSSKKFNENESGND